MINTTELKNTYYNLIADTSAYDLDMYFYEDKDYLSDSISNCADSQVDIYNDDLIEWLRNNDWRFDDSVKEFGYCGEFYQQVRTAQYMAYEEEIYNNLENFIVYMAFKIAEEYAEELTEEQAENIENITDNNELDSNATYLELKEAVKEILNNKEA